MNIGFEGLPRCQGCGKRVLVGVRVLSGLESSGGIRTVPVLGWFHLRCARKLPK